MKKLGISTTELAKICGVSQGTVDRALNNRSDIKSETRNRILSVAKQYGYREHIEGESIIKGQIGIIVFNLENEYFSELISETEFCLRKRNFGATVMISHYDKSYEIECIRNLYNMGVDGIIICSVNRGVEFDNYLRLFDIPIIAVGNKISSTPYVGIDDYTAMFDLTVEELNEHYENIIYFSPALNYNNAYSQKLRYEGFKKAIRNKNYSVICNINEIKENYSLSTLIICSTDYYALQVYFKTKGVKIVGFDNIRILDKYHFNIDSVDYSMSEIAESAVEKVITQNKSDTIVPHRIIKR